MVSGAHKLAGGALVSQFAGVRGASLVKITMTLPSMTQAMRQRRGADAPLISRALPERGACGALTGPTGVHGSFFKPFVGTPRRSAGTVGAATRKTPTTPSRAVATAEPKPRAAGRGVRRIRTVCPHAQR